VTNYLVDVDVDGVHLVGEPANKRKFAVVKNLSAQKPEEQTVTNEELIAAAKAAKDLDLDALIAAVGKDAVTKALGDQKPTDQKPAELDKSKLPVEVRAYVEGLEAKTAALETNVNRIVKEREDEQKAALRKRAEALKAAGYELDVEKVTEERVAALEHADAAISKRLESAGIFQQKGSPKEGETPDLATAVHKEVRNQLGREPIDAVEESRELHKVLSGRPGLATDLLRDERRRRNGGE
jgi:alanyl-tRNA synthetase